jgi:hypothetical protein
LSVTLQLFQAGFLLTNLLHARLLSCLGVHLGGVGEIHRSEIEEVEVRSKGKKYELFPLEVNFWPLNVSRDVRDAFWCEQGANQSAAPRQKSFCKSYKPTIFEIKKVAIRLQSPPPSPIALHSRRTLTNSRLTALFDACKGFYSTSVRYISASKPPNFSTTVANHLHLIHNGFIRSKRERKMKRLAL